MLIISMILFISVPVFAEGDQQQDTDLRSEVVFADDSRYQDIIQIPLTYYDTDNHIYTWKFPYTDDFFRYPSDEFSMLLAQGSVGLTISAFRYDKTNYTPGFTEYMESAGFHDVESFGYDKPTTPDSLAGYVASKTVDDTTVIAAVTCGSGYGKEWARNFLVGDGERHEGFNKSAQNLEKHIQDYIKKHHITGKKKLWISGHSKAGAIANLTAADMIETGLFDDVYAYMTAVPRTTKEPVAYSGIYNICGICKTCGKLLILSVCKANILYVYSCEERNITDISSFYGVGNHYLVERYTVIERKIVNTDYRYSCICLFGDDYFFDAVRIFYFC